MSKQIDLEKLRARASGLPDSDGAIGPTWCTPTEVLELLDRIAALEMDAARMDWMDKQGRVCIERVREGHIKGTIRWDVEYWYYEGGAKSKQGMRQAIDTAMEASNAKAD